MRTHPARLSAAGITPWRYAELRAVCRQYREYRRALERARQGIVDRPARRSGKWRRPDPTGNAAVSIAAMPEQRMVRQIDQSAAAVAEPAVAAGIVKSVTEGIPYEKLRKRPPCGRNQFYVLVHLFYIELDARLRED